MTMSRAHVVAVVAVVFVALFVLRLVRTRRLKGKYSLLWVAACAVQVIVVLFPGLANAFADLVGIRSPAIALIFTSMLVLALVAVDLSFELSQAEDRTRRLAEELALLQLRVSELEDDADAP
jgi:hypothetical protein